MTHCASHESRVMSFFFFGHIKTSSFLIINYIEYQIHTTINSILFYRHVAVAGIWGLLALHLADDSILPFNYLNSILFYFIFCCWETYQQIQWKGFFYKNFLELYINCTKKREECELSIWFKSANLVCKNKILFFFWLFPLFSFHFFDITK